MLVLIAILISFYAVFHAAKAAAAHYGYHFGEGPVYLEVMHITFCVVDFGIVVFLVRYMI